MQLSNNSIEIAAKTLSEMVRESVNRNVEQSTDNMNEISKIVTNIADYVNESNAKVNETVRNKHAYIASNSALKNECIPCIIL